MTIHHNRITSNPGVASNPCIFSNNLSQTPVLAIAQATPCKVTLLEHPVVNLAGSDASSEWIQHLDFVCFSAITHGCTPCEWYGTASGAYTASSGRCQEKRLQGDFNKIHEMNSEYSAATHRPLSYHDSTVLVIAAHLLWWQLFFFVLSSTERLVSKWHSVTSTNPKAGK